MNTLNFCMESHDMKEITIDCSAVRCRKALHHLLAEALDFPEWYGNNLDALYDCLTDLSEEIHLSLRNFPDFPGFRETLTDAEAENDCLKVTIL